MNELLVAMYAEALGYRLDNHQAKSISDKLFGCAPDDIECIRDIILQSCESFNKLKNNIPLRRLNQDQV